MTGKIRKMHWMAALLLIGTTGGAMAGPVPGPYGAFNRGGGGGGFNGLGPYQQCPSSAYTEMGRAGATFYVSRRPARLITTTIQRAEPVAELTTSSCGTLAPVAERTTIRQTRLIINEPARRTWTREFRSYRPARMITTTRTTRLAPVQELEAVAEQTTIRPAARRIWINEPACGVSNHLYR